MLRRRFQILFLATAVLAVFYVGISSELNSIDDVGMVTGMINTDHWTLRDLFFPKGGLGLYHRPFLSLSFLLDKELWFMDSSFLHLENILLHLLNAFLVYGIALKLLPEPEGKTSYLPLVAALCFALHPVTAESVNWVSGRTDLLAGTFLLLSALSLLFFKMKQCYRYLFLAALALLCATLTKEVSLAFLLSAFFILNAKGVQHASVVRPSGERLKGVAPQIFIAALIATGFIMLCVYLSTHPYRFNSSKLRMTFHFMSDDPYHALFVFLRTFGFYIKKLYWPFPLNFAILEVDPVYELLAVPVVLICGYLAIRRNILSALFLAGTCMITPAFIPAFNQVAWTPYAERYVYIASAFVVTASVLFVGKVAATNRVPNWAKACVPCLIGIMAVATFQRNQVWQTNLALYTDTVAKTPEFSKAWGQLGLAYYANKDLVNAERCFAKASATYSYVLGYDERTDLNYASILSETGKTKEAEKVFEKALKRSEGGSARLLEAYISFLSNKIINETNRAVVVATKAEIVEKSELLFSLNGQPFSLYNAGALAIDIGDRRKAIECFTKLYETLPEKDRYKKLAKEQLARL